MVAQHVDGARLTHGSTNPKHRDVVLLEGCRVVGLLVVDAMIGGEDDEQVLPGGCRAYLIDKIVEAVVEIGEGIEYFIIVA